MDTFNFRLPQDMKPDETKNEIIQVSMIKSNYDRLRKIAKSSGLRTSKLVRNILDDYLLFYDSKTKDN